MTGESLSAALILGSKNMKYMLPFVQVTVMMVPLVHLPAAQVFKLGFDKSVLWDYIHCQSHPLNLCVVKSCQSLEMLVISLLKLLKLIL